MRREICYLYIVWIVCCVKTVFNPILCYKQFWKSAKVYSLLIEDGFILVKVDILVNEFYVCYVHNIKL